jgi:hypothetical protein
MTKLFSIRNLLKNIFRKCDLEITFGSFCTVSVAVHNQNYFLMVFFSINPQSLWKATSPIVDEEDAKV